VDLDGWDPHPSYEGPDDLVGGMRFAIFGSTYDATRTRST
jgi:hypothetical protein